MPDHISNKQSNDSNNKASEINYLQSQLLISMPGLDDPYFKQSVTLICQHSSDGCFGLTINKPIDITVDEVLKQLNLEQTDDNNDASNEKINLENKAQKSPALRGGPVQIEQGFIIHDGEQLWANTMAVHDDLYVTASQDILEDIAGGKGPKNYLLTLGCASWEAGQIEAEVLNNSWLHCPIDKNIVFDMPFESRWQGAAETLGINLSAMSGISGHD